MEASLALVGVVPFVFGYLKGLTWFLVATAIYLFFVFNYVYNFRRTVIRRE